MQNSNKSFNANGSNSDIEMTNNTSEPNMQNIAKQITEVVINKVDKKLDLMLSKFMSMQTQQFEKVPDNGSSKNSKNKNKISKKGKNSKNAEIVITRDNLPELTVAHLTEDPLPEIVFRRNVQLSSIDDESDSTSEDLRDRLKILNNFLRSKNIKNSLNVSFPQDQHSGNGIVYPPAEQAWENFRSMASSRLSCATKAKFFKTLADEEIFPDWTICYNPPREVIISQASWEKVVETRKENATSMLMAQAELYTLKAENAKVQANAYLSAMKDVYRSANPGEYNMQAAIKAALDSAENTRAETYKTYLVKYQNLAPRAQEFLYKGLGNDPAPRKKDFPAPLGQRQGKRPGGKWQSTKSYTIPRRGKQKKYGRQEDRLAKAIAQQLAQSGTFRK